MRPTIRILVAAAIFGLAPAGFAQDKSGQEPLVRTGPRTILVVVSPANPTARLTVAQVRRIFLREVTVWSNGWPISVFERSTDQPIRTTFSSTVIGKTPAQLFEHRLGQALTRGLAPAKVCPTSSLLHQYLERIKGGIGYVYEDEVEPGMTIVARVLPKSDR